MALVRQYRPVVAFDIGAEKSVVAAATERLTSGATLVPNEISKLSTPSAVSFRGKDRLVGETANSGMASHIKNSVEFPVLSLPSDQHPSGDSFSISHSLPLPAELSEASFSSEAVTGFLIGRLHSFYEKSEEGKKHRERLLKLNGEATEGKGEGVTTRYVFVVPSARGKRHSRAMREAAFIAGIGGDEGVDVVSHSEALIRAFEKKNMGFPEARKESTKIDKEENTADSSEKAEVDKSSPTEAAEEGKSSDGQDKGGVTLIVDVGGSQTTAIAFRQDGEHRIEVLAVVETVGIGKAASLALPPTNKGMELDAGSISLDGAVAQHVLNAVKEKHGVDLSNNRKAIKKIFAGCDKVKKLLSTVPEASATVENLLGDEGDYTIVLSRAEFERLADPHLQTIEAVIKAARAKATRFGASSAEETLSSSLLTVLNRDNDNDLSDSPLAKVDRIEVVGGGSRVPCVQERIKAASGLSSLGFTLDSTSALATGASFAAACSLGENDSDIAKYCRDLVFLSDKPSLSVSPLVRKSSAVETANDEVEQDEGMQAEDLLQQRERERILTSLDIAKQKFEMALNSFESYILSMRNECNGRFAKELDGEKIRPLLDEAEDWLYSEEAEEKGEEGVHVKRENLEKTLKELCPSYFEKLEEEKQKRLEEERKRDEEIARESANEEVEDKDQRKMKKSDRIRLALKNKEEGNELFKGGNLTHAVSRYTKALTHLSKCFDLSPDDEKEIEGIKVPCYNNLAACYLKLETYDKAIENCKKVLEIDPNAVKALFRKGQGHLHTKEYDEAVKDLTKASELAPDDKGIKKFLDVAQKRKAEFKKKEKAMFSKMFG